MNIWEQIAEYNSQTNKLQYKKWLDVSSSHFFSIEVSEEVISFKNQKNIAKKAIEIFNETGNHLVYLSNSSFFINDHNEPVPFFLTPIMPLIKLKEKKIIWSILSTNFRLNSVIHSSKIELDFNEIESWIDSQEFIEKKNIEALNSSLYFNLNIKQFVRNDIKVISDLKQESHAMQELFHDEIKLNKIEKEPDFLDLIHIIPMDYSQAKTITAAQQKSIIISGPPGTGKSQTIINLAVNEINQGKTCAIVSQKLAAVDVIQDRLKRLGLENIALCIERNHANEKESILKIESRLNEILEFKNEEFIPKINHVYFQHCIRTIEEYYQAKHLSVKNSPYRNLEQNQLIKFLKWFPPNINLISLSINEILQKLTELKSKLIDLNLDFKDEKFNSFNLIFPIYTMLLKVDMDELKQYLADKKTKKYIQDIDKKLKLIISKKPVESILSRLSSEKLEFYYKNLNSTSNLLDLFNRKLKLIVSEVESIDKNWTKKNNWEKLEEIKRALEYKNWEKEYNYSLNQKIEVFPINYDKNTFEILNYIDEKLKAKIPHWQLAYLWLIKDKYFESKKKKWKELFDIYNWIVNFNQDFSKFEIKDFIQNVNTELDTKIHQNEWERLCSIESNFNLVKESDYPILKNYSSREIVTMAKYLRQNYNQFCHYHRELFIYNNINASSKSILDTINSRKRDTTELRSSIKKNIQFIQKNWSKKRKSPSFQQYISQLDFDFIQKIHPLFVGTLDSFSQYIPLELNLYDTIIIDESSQVEVMDCIPALYRAKKVIIVGDEKQLSPTRFFKSATSIYPHESILELGDEKLYSYQLNYHFRSKYSNLIDFSNQNFYKKSLQSNNKNSMDAIEWVYCPEGVYHQRSNRIEAENIVLKLVEYSRLNLNLSFGIICFSIQQKEMVETLIEKEQMMNENFNKFINAQLDKNEPIFIKSIEQVQGYERDIILISSAYARNPEGKFYQFFGPILSYKGENRLNVLMSRAREKIIFMSSIKSSDIHTKADSSQGLLLFKKLFEFLENGYTVSQESTMKKLNYWEYFLNPFKG